MGTKERRARSKENLREEILEAARALFIKEGFDHVSIRKIADKIEYSPGTIYLYFQDKIDIFRTICEEAFGKLHQRLSAIVEDSAPPLEKLRRAGRAYISFALENPAHYTLVFLTAAKPALETLEHDAGFSCFQDVCQIVQQCLDEGVLRGDDVNELSQAIWANVHGVAALLIVKGGHFPFVEATRLIERVIDITLEGVRKHG